MNEGHWAGDRRAVWDSTRMVMEILTWLQLWFSSHCDVEWEHGGGVRIETLDNPGWHVSVALSDTEFELRPFSPVRIERSESDWIHCSLRDGIFDVACGPG